MSDTKSVLTNFKFVLLGEREKHFQFFKDEEEVRRYKEEGKLKDGDMVVALTPETLRVATLKNYIELI